MTTPRFRAAWWAYLAIMLLLHVGSILLLVGSGDVEAFLWFCIGSLSLIGLFGYVAQRPFLWPKLWVVAGVAQLVSFTIGAYRAGSDIVDLGPAIALLMSIPMVWALFAYGLGSPHLWKRTNRV